MKRIKYPKRGTPDFTSLVNDYLSIFSATELKTMQSEWAKWKRRNHITTIRETVRELLLADVTKLADIFEKFKALPIPVQVRGKTGRKIRNPEFVVLDKIFKYTNHYDDRIAEFFCKYADILRIISCHYCETAYVNTYRVTKNSSKVLRHFDLDHYFPKNECPIIGLSLFNFVPSCQVCNSRIKKQLLIGTTKAQWIQFNPVSETYNFSENVTIRLRMHRRPDTTFRKKGEYYIYFRCKSGFRVAVEFFHLEERYEFHKMEAMRIKELKARYPQSARKKIAGLLGIRESEVKEDLFHEHYLKENDRCFAKLTSDMLS